MYGTNVKNKQKNLLFPLYMQPHFKVPATKHLHTIQQLQKNNMCTLLYIETVILNPIYTIKHNL